MDIEGLFNCGQPVKQVEEVMTICLGINFFFSMDVSVLLWMAINPLFTFSIRFSWIVVYPNLSGRWSSCY